MPEMRALAVRDEASIFGRSGLKNRAGEQREDFLANRKLKGRRFGYCLSNQKQQSRNSVAVVSLSEEYIVRIKMRVNNLPKTCAFTV